MRRFVYNDTQTPQSAPGMLREGSISPGSAQSIETHKKNKDHLSDLEKFLKYIDHTKLSKADKEKFDAQKQRYITNFAKLDQESNPQQRRNNVEMIRRGGVTKEEDLKNPLLRHTRLSTAYLEKQPGQSLSFVVNFRGNDMAEWRVGAADMLPNSVYAISIQKGGETVNAIRARNLQTGRIGYYDAEALKSGIYNYIAVHTGDIITITETRSENTQLKLAWMKEHVAIYKEGAMTDGASDGDERRYDVGNNRLYGTPREAQKVAITRSTKSRLAEFRRENFPQVDTSKMRRRIVEAARARIGDRYFEENYYSKNSVYKNGMLGCAITASTILADVDAIGKTDPRVNIVEKELVENNGWTSTPGYNPNTVMPGDVIIWRTVKGGKETGRHIGIVVGINPPKVVHNVAIRDENGKIITAAPKETLIKRQKYISAVLKPPGTRRVAKAKKIGNKVEKKLETNSIRLQIRRTKNARKIAEDHNVNARIMKIAAGKERQLSGFWKKFERNKSMYNRIAAKTDFPPILLAIIHYRENGAMKFNCYLHNGQRLGKKQQQSLQVLCLIEDNFIKQLFML